MIGETLQCDAGPVIKGSLDDGVPAYSDYATWAVEFNSLYKQSKHADHPLPDPYRGSIAARSGARLLRMWLAVEFGVDPATVERR
ncbi:hypothetical protein [Mycobacteroides abscessus]|uniref:hypothetical protein n=1 Tax=Mycobacteroides abscessus TaxID=36809 RepID=UPI000C255D1E|nr:hypothetical protein [Mycobacteroides abscessus]MBN7437903.1 hypothetical protein [Mycobacteroides abscessus subsp. abscessus]MDM1888387.1 hypothetical protein [Mycobacteroides abscessus]MDM1893191.1 hypothetical protein [Mycobacteroides abscessus]MDO3110991.1 hypothetical protein [Mycobacteroides abscessus subsp. abscessus]RIS00121.1 hypothetical protein D2E45_15905 [Mycobacteroides abscessus]